MSAFYLSTGAEQYLDEIWEYIARDKVSAANRWTERLYEAFETIARRPTIGHQREDLTSLEILFWPVKEYLIFYRISGQTVEIVGVTEGSRDVPMLLAQRVP